MVASDIYMHLRSHSTPKVFREHLLDIRHRTWWPIISIRLLTNRVLNIETPPMSSQINAIIIPPNSQQRVLQLADRLNDYFNAAHIPEEQKDAVLGIFTSDIEWVDHANQIRREGHEAIWECLKSFRANRDPFRSQLIVRCVRSKTFLKTRSCYYLIHQKDFKWSTLS